MANARNGQKPPNGDGNAAWSALGNYLDSAFQQLRHIRQQSIPTQIGIGAGAGLVTGYVFGKTSKAAALLAGCSLISVLFLNHRGYLKINRSQLRRDLDELHSAVRKELGLRKSVVPSEKEVDDVLSKYAYLLCGYAAGSCIGYGLT